MKSIVTAFHCNMYDDCIETVVHIVTYVSQICAVLDLSMRLVPQPLFINPCGQNTLDTRIYKCFNKYAKEKKDDMNWVSQCILDEHLIFSCVSQAVELHWLTMSSVCCLPFGFYVCVIFRAWWTTFNQTLINSCYGHEQNIMHVDVIHRREVFYN